MFEPREQRFGELMYRRAIGEAPEMECARSLCRLLEPFYEPGMRLLDAGCGGGHYLSSFRRRLDPAIDYTGIDSSSHYIGLARRAFPDVDSFDVGLVEQLPYDDDAFDLVVCSNVLPNLAPPPTAALAELMRVARRLVVVRTLFAEANYLIREIDSIAEDELGLIGADGEPVADATVHNNIYSERLLRQAIAAIDARVEPVIEPDTHASAFASDHPAGTRTLGAQQIAGPLLLDWRFIVIPMPGPA